MRGDGGVRLDVKINKPRLFITQFSGGNTVHTHTSVTRTQTYRGNPNNEMWEFI